MAGRTEIDGDQIQEETVTGADILDESIKSTDVDLPNLATGIVNNPTAIQTIDGALVFGNDRAEITRQESVTVTGSAFVSYETLDFNVSDTSGTNKYRLNLSFKWSHDSASNDGRFRMYLDGAFVGEEIRIEPKDQGSDQRIQNNILHYAENLSQGSHTLELRFRPSTASRDTTVHKAVIEAWRFS